MRRKTVELILAAAAVVMTATVARAQPMVAPGAGGGGRMPDLSQIVGRPLPDRGMPTGTVSVRVARKMPANAVADVEVSAVIKNAGGDLRKRTLKTDDSGRAIFEGMVPGDEFLAEVNVDGEHLQTERFTMPAQGGVRTMLISGVTGGSAGGQGQGQGNDEESEGGTAPAAGAAGERNPRAFALGATAGTAEPDGSLPTGTLEVVLRDENQAPIPNHPVTLGMVNKQGEVEVHRAESDASGKARFTALPTGSKTGYAVVIDWHGLRLNTAPFAMPENGGARAEIRALARTADPGVITIGAGGRIVVQMHEDSLQFLEFLPLENTTDKMFDPGPGALEIPLPTGFVGAQPQENERKIDVRQNHGIAVHGPIVPKGSQLGVPDADRQANEVVFGFVLPYHGDTHVFSQPAPNGIGQLTLITDQKLEGLTISGAGVGTREERTVGGHKYWVMAVAGVPAGGAITFTMSGLPSNESWGRTFAGVLALALIGGAIAFGRRPAGGARGKHVSPSSARATLVEKRESLFSELVTLERTARAAGAPAPADQRRQLVARLEQVYQDIAALDEPRAA